MDCRHCTADRWPAKPAGIARQERQIERRPFGDTMARPPRGHSMTPATPPTRLSGIACETCQHSQLFGLTAPGWVRTLKHGRYGNAMLSDHSGRFWTIAYYKASFH